MKKVIYIPFVAVLLLTSCRSHEPAEPVRFLGETQGTYYAVTYYSPDNTNYQKEIDSVLKEVDQSVSLWNPGSVLSRVNRNEPDIIADEIFIALFKRSKQVFEETGGAFDPSVGPLVNAWGFGFTDRKKIDQQRIDSLLLLVGFKKVELETNTVVKSEPGIQLDFNAIAQGFSVDMIARFLEDRGIKNFLVDIGGEVYGKGKKSVGEPWKVGIEKPSDNAGYGEGLKAIVRLTDKALATSGSYRKFFEEEGVRYSHTIDPVTGYPVRHSLLSVSVLAKDCATADAFATGFMVWGVERSKAFLENRKDLEAFFIYEDENKNLKTYYTPGFKEIIVEEIE
jgi:thiamine biosynthesis lipoprotein